MGERRPQKITSPPWQPATRLVAALLLLLIAGLLIYRLRSLVSPVLLAGLLAYVLNPVVVMLNRHARIPRPIAVLLVFLVIVLLVAGVTAWAGIAVSQQLVGLIQDLRMISEQIPELIASLSELRFSIGPWTLDLSQVNLAPLLEGVGSTIQPLLFQTGSLLGSIAGATASAVGMALAVMVVSFYFLVDPGDMERGVIQLVPVPYREDFERLLHETGRVWRGFLRGQLILALAMGVLVSAFLGALGLRFALVLGLIAAVMEFIPIFGPLIAGLVAVLVAFFEGGNWWGLSPLWLSVAVLSFFVVVQQIENNVLVPRIIGHSLRLHPLVVLLAALAGTLLAGVLGLLLAAPTVATLRLWVGYVYSKAVGLDTWPGPALELPSGPRARRIVASLRRSWRKRRPRPSRKAPPSDMES